MNNKLPLLLIVSFVLLMLLVISKCSGNDYGEGHTPIEDSYRNNIEMVLALDSRISSNASSGERVSTMRQIDTSNCPNDFIEAYNTHIDAWNNYNKNASCFWTVLGTGLTLLTCGADEGAGMALGIEADCENAQKLSKEITNSYIDCIEVAEKHGVDVRKYKRRTK